MHRWLHGGYSVIAPAKGAAPLSVACVAVVWSGRRPLASRVGEGSQVHEDLVDQETAGDEVLGDYADVDAELGG